jgi:ABC-type transport system substrate-binding protein
MNNAVERRCVHVVHRIGLGRWLLALTLIVSLAACRGGKASEDKPNANSRFTFAVGDPTSLDPVTADGNNVNGWILFNIYQTLIRPNAEGDGFEPDLAETWSVSPEGTTWTFNLRKDAKFSDGKGVTAKDVVFSLNRTKDIKGIWQWMIGPCGQDPREG